MPDSNEQNLKFKRRFAVNFRRKKIDSSKEKIFQPQEAPDALAHTEECVFRGNFKQTKIISLVLASKAIPHRIQRETFSIETPENAQENFREIFNSNPRENFNSNSREDFQENSQNNPREISPKNFQANPRENLNSTSGDFFNPNFQKDSSEIFQATSREVFNSSSPENQPIDASKNLTAADFKTKSLGDFQENSPGDFQTSNPAELQATSREIFQKDSPENFQTTPPETSQKNSQEIPPALSSEVSFFAQKFSSRFRKKSSSDFLIFVDDYLFEEASRQIEIYRKENPETPENPPLPLYFSLQPLPILLFPALFTLLDFSGNFPMLHFRGIADAEKILRGEWFRTVTALFLHGDLRHIVSNLLSGYAVLNLLSFRLPLARIAPALLLASALANRMVAETVQTDFRSLGFSTFVFSALGALSLIEFRLARGIERGFLRRMAPLAGALSLALFLGIGENSDILAHGYGFLLGAFVGMIPRKYTLLRRLPLKFSDVLFSLLSLFFIILSWFFALH